MKMFRNRQLKFVWFTRVMPSSFEKDCKWLQGKDLSEPALVEALLIYLLQLLQCVPHLLKSFIDITLEIQCHVEKLKDQFSFKKIVINFLWDFHIFKSLLIHFISNIIISSQWKYKSRNSRFLITDKQFVKSQFLKLSLSVSFLS